MSYGREGVPLSADSRWWPVGPGPRPVTRRHRSARQASVRVQPSFCHLVAERHPSHATPCPGSTWDWGFCVRTPVSAWPEGGQALGQRGRTATSAAASSGTPRARARASAWSSWSARCGRSSGSSGSRSWRSAPRWSALALCVNPPVRFFVARKEWLWVNSQTPFPANPSVAVSLWVVFVRRATERDSKSLSAFPATTWVIHQEESCYEEGCVRGALTLV